MGETLTQSRKLSSEIKLEVKQIVTQALFFNELLDLSAIKIMHSEHIKKELREATFALRHYMDNWALLMLEHVGQSTELWIDKKIQSEVFKQALPAFIGTVAKLKGRTAELIYTETAQLVNKVVEFKGRTVSLNHEKYELLLKFIAQEMDAELSGGSTSLEVQDGALIFKIQPQKSNFQEGVTV